MKRVRLLLIVVVVFVIVDLLLVFFLSTKTSETNIDFLSFRPGFSRNIDKPKKEEFENKLVYADAQIDKILIIMPPDNKKATNGTGWGDGNPSYYVEWRAVAGYEIYTFYLDKSELS